jgi:hypothetical protein
MLKPFTVMKKWLAITIQKRNSRLAKKYAKMAGMRSMGEVRCAADMDKRKIKYKYEAIKIQYQYEPQVYTPDFVLENDAVIEYKGKMTNETRKKILAIIRCNPNIRFHLVFEKPNNKIRKGSKTTYWQWAEKNNIPWSEHFVREEWLNGMV